MKLTTKMYYGFFLIPALIISSIAVYSIYSFWRIDRQIQTIYDDRVIGLEKLKMVSDGYAFSIVNAANKANERIITRQAALKFINQAINQIENSWITYKKTYMTLEEKELVREVEILFVPADTKIRELKQVLETGDILDIDSFEKTLYEVIDPLTEKIEELSYLQSQEAATEREKARQIYQQTLLLFTILLVSAAIIASPIGFFFSTSINTTIKETISSITNSANRIAIATEEQEKITEKQAVAVIQTTTTVQELNTSSKNTADQAALVAKGAENTLNFASEGIKTVELSLEKMNLLKNTVEAIAQQSNRLSEQTEQINNITNLVNNLANQTNILALNATVEAVRAGEKGKGFAVVAAEIRKLAEQSKQSVEQIDALIVNIQSRIKSTVKVTQDGSKTVTESEKFAQEMVVIFTGVKEAANEGVLGTQQIALTVKEQAGAIQQVLAVINTLNKANEQANTGIYQTKIAIKQLSETAMKLNSEV